MRVCDMNAYSILGPSESVPRDRHRMFAGIHPYLSGCCFVLLFSVDNVTSSRTSSSLRPRAATCWPKAQYPYPVCFDFGRASTRQRVLDVCCVWIRIVFRYRPPTSGVSPFVPATILGLFFKQDNCIVVYSPSAPTWNSRRCLDLLLREIVKQ